MLPWACVLARPAPCPPPPTPRQGVVWCGRTGGGSETVMSHDLIMGAGSRVGQGWSGPLAGTIQADTHFSHHPCLPASLPASHSASTLFSSSLSTVLLCISPSLSRTQPCLCSLSLSHHFFLCAVRACLYPYTVFSLLSLTLPIVHPPSLVPFFSLSVLALPFL